MYCERRFPNTSQERGISAGKPHPSAAQSCSALRPSRARGLRRGHCGAGPRVGKAGPGAQAGCGGHAARGLQGRARAGRGLAAGRGGTGRPRPRRGWSGFSEGAPLQLGHAGSWWLFSRLSKTRVPHHPRGAGAGAVLSPHPEGLGGVQVPRPEHLTAGTRGKRPRCRFCPKQTRPRCPQVSARGDPARGTVRDALCLVERLSTPGGSNELEPPFLMKVSQNN